MGSALVTAVLRRHAVSLSLGALVLLVAVASGSLLGARPGLRDVVGTGLDAIVQRHDLLTVLTAAVFAPSLGALLLGLVGIVAVMGGAERLLGHARTALVAVGSTVLGVAIGIVLQAAGVLVRGVWSQAPLDTLVVDPLIPVAGTAMAASAFAGPLWRRRIRVLGFTALVVVLLYSGEPGDAYRLAAGGVGLVLGLVLTRHRPRLRWRRSSHHETRSLVAAVVGVTAVGPVVAVLSPHGYGPLRPLGLLFRDSLPGDRFLRDPCDGFRGSAECVRQVALAHVNGPGAAVMPVLVLAAALAAAWGMWYGRRAGAVIAVLLNAMVAALTAVFFGVLPALRHPSTLLGPAVGPGPTLQTTLAALVPAAVAVLVLVNIRHFDVRPRRSATVAAVAAVGTALLVGAVSSVLAGVLLPGQFRPRSDLASALADLPQRYIPIGFLHLQRLRLVPVGQPAHLIHDWTGPLLWATVLITTVVLRFDVRVPPGADDPRLRRLLHVGAAGSISYMATWPGNVVRFSADRDHAIAYREIGGVALALGEPIGGEAGRVAAAREFAVACDDQGLTPVFYAVSPAFARALSDERRWAVATIGEDTVVRTRELAMTGKRWQDVRTSINRAKRLGITTSWTTWNDCTTVQRAQITAISEEWVADRGLPELGFTLGGIDELRDADVRLMLALDADGRVIAATSWLPTWRDEVLIGWTLDFMRRSAETMNGLMEFVIAQVLLLAQEQDMEFVSLSASPLALSDVEEDGPLDRLLRVLSRVLEPAYGFASLASFKAKFQPELEPLVLAYPDSLALPATGLALTRAYLPHLTARAAVRLVSAFR
jgi:phosphatidylglycerol lysyltransferase